MSKKATTPKAKKPAAKKPVKRQGDFFFKGQNAPFNSERLAKDILAKREKDGLSFSAIEEATTIPATTIFRAEVGKGGLNVIAVASICNWLGVPVQKYFTK
jgi:hypothetical protein